jgi:hypothetical protein
MSIDAKIGAMFRFDPYFPIVLICPQGANLMMEGFMGAYKKVAFCIVALGFAVVPLCLTAAQEAARPVSDDAVLKGILENTGLYCKKLQDFMYYFVCHEFVTETLRGASKTMPSQPSMGGMTGTYGGAEGTTFSVTSGSTTNTYLYDYQMVRKKGNNQESRTLLKKNGQNQVVPNARLEAIRFYFQNMAFGPIDLFGTAGRLKHNYRIVGSEKIKGQNATIIEAAPKDDSPDYNPSGKVWLRESDNAILKIEWDQRSLFGFKDVQAAAEKIKLTPVISLVTEYGVEKNGIRFPSRVVFQEAYVRNKDKKKRLV